MSHAHSGLGNGTLSRSLSDLGTQTTTTTTNVATATAAGRRTRAPNEDPTLRIRCAYDGYLSSAVALCVQQKNAREIAANVGPQQNVFAELMASLRRELSALRESLATKNGLKAEKEQLVEKIEALEMINTYITLDNDEDAIAETLFADTASKVIVKNFREMDADDLSATNKMLEEIINSLKSFDCQSKIDIRNKLKDFLIQVTLLTTKLKKQKSKCEEMFKEKESLQNHNSSLKILKAQFEENPKVLLLPKKLSLVEEFDKILDELNL